MWPSAPHIVSTMEKWPGSEELNQAAYKLARHTDLTLFEDTSGDKTGLRAKRFVNSMSFSQTNLTIHASFIVENYDWAAYKTVVDAGDSQGDVAFELVR